MRLAILSTVSVAALVVAAPAGVSTTLALVPSLTLGVEGMSEVPVTLPTTDPTAAVAGTNKQAKAKNFGRAFVTAVPRNVRTADYGVSPDAAFDKAPSQPQSVAPLVVAPVAAATTPTVATAAASPEPTASQVLAARDFEPGDFKYDAAASKTPVKAASAPGAANPLSQPPSVPPKLVLPQSPVSSNGNPDFSILSKAAAVGLQSIGAARYNVSDLAHGSAAQAFGSQGKSTTTSSDPAPASPALPPAEAPPMAKRLIQPINQVEDVPPPAYPMAYEMPEYVEEGPEQREMVENAEQKTTPVDEQKAAVMDKQESFGKRHSLTFNTDSILPNRPDPNANLSDPLVAQRVQQDKHVALVNVDSNKKPTAPTVKNLTQDAQEAQKEVEAQEAAKAAKAPPPPGTAEALRKAGPGTPPTMPKLHKLPSMPNAPSSDATETTTAM